MGSSFVRQVHIRRFDPPSIFRKFSPLLYRCRHEPHREARFISEFTGLETATNIAALATKTSLAVAKIASRLHHHLQTEEWCDLILFPNFEPWITGYSLALLSHIFVVGDFQPSQTGNYTVFLSCDDGCDLWIRKVHEVGLDEKEYGDDKASVPVLRLRKYTGHLQWSKYVFWPLCDCWSLSIILERVVWLLHSQVETVRSPNLLKRNLWASDVVRIGSIIISRPSKLWKATLHSVWSYMFCEAAGEIWNWSLLGVKGLKPDLANPESEKFIISISQQATLNGFKRKQTKIFRPAPKFAMRTFW